jgi:hypothetical protein
LRGSSASGYGQQERLRNESAFAAMRITTAAMRITTGI